MNKKQKHIFHASKVDRIAIVDRPAVPDAEILVFKRESKKVQENDILSKALGGADFKAEFASAQAVSATQVLESMFWRTVYDTESKDSQGDFKKVLKSFEQAILSILGGIEYAGTEEKAEKAQASTQEIVDYFKRGLEVSAISEGFAYFKNMVWSLVAQAGEIKNVTSVAKAMVNAFGEFIDKHSEAVVAKVNKNIVVDKEGRIISSARLRKLTEAMQVIGQIVEEATPKEKVRLFKREEEIEMEIKEVQELLEKALAPVNEEIKGFKDTLIEKGIIEKELTEEEKKAKEEAEKKAQEEVEKKEQEEKELKEKQEAEAKAEAEKQAKAEQELKEKAEKQEKELEEMKSKLEVMDKAFSAFEKRTGIKVSLDVAEKSGEETKEKGDPFAEAMKG